MVLLVVCGGALVVYFLAGEVYDSMGVEGSGEIEGAHV